MTVLDANGNVILDPGTVQLSSSDPQAYAADHRGLILAAARNGSATDLVQLLTAGTQTITFAVGSVIAQASVQVAPGSPVSLSISSPVQLCPVRTSR